MQKLNQEKKLSWLTWALRGFLALGFLVLSVRLFELQIIKGSYFRSLSDENRIRRISITAARGKILARGGEELVSNN
ncbi:penicillin-binding protein 2, partial [Candidatus Woesebacteria bacterium]|nr:penicillin-binding protein 2 [Candidatus Woesebacteria bacterium]